MLSIYPRIDSHVKKALVAVTTKVVDPIGCRRSRLSEPQPDCARLQMDCGESYRDRCLCVRLRNIEQRLNHAYPQLSAAENKFESEWQFFLSASDALCHAARPGLHEQFPG
jgi:uncharacterized protein YecT (DUF1311 family)